jgi:anti-sigma regulatory factor (Ser/Thr protein kinase)
MARVPVVSNDPTLIDRIAPLVAAIEGYEPFWVEEGDAALSCIEIELPELVIIDVHSESEDAQKLLEAMSEDPWLLHGGVILLCKDLAEAQKLANTVKVNVVATVQRGVLERQLATVLDVLRGCKRILFQREIGADFVGHIAAAFELKSDPLAAATHANLICNFLYNSNKVSVERKGAVRTALVELLINAIEHGNCGITYEEKAAHLEAGGDPMELIARHTQDPTLAARRVRFEYTIYPDSVVFTIADQGGGFDWKKRLEELKGDDVWALNGRGILMATESADTLAYNESGNEVQVKVTYEEDAGTLVPGLFQDAQPRKIEPGDHLFKEGDSGDFIYYIVKGVYEVLAKGKRVSTLSADDVFIGEMSFLLNTTRTATVRAITQGTVVEISRRAFVEAVRQKPHYALFLSRLLAQRIARGNLHGKRGTRSSHQIMATTVGGGGARGEPT